MHHRGSVNVETVSEQPIEAVETWGSRDGACGNVEMWLVKVEAVEMWKRGAAAGASHAKVKCPH